MRSVQNLSVVAYVFKLRSDRPVEPITGQTFGPSLIKNSKVEKLVKIGQKPSLTGNRLIRIKPSF